MEYWIFLVLTGTFGGQGKEINGLRKVRMFAQKGKTLGSHLFPSTPSSAIHISKLLLTHYVLKLELWSSSLLGACQYGTE